MHIDWLTFAAQCLNFLILVALLKRFLYGPVLAAVAAREQGFAARENELKTRTAKVASDETVVKQALEDLEAQRLARLAAIEAEVKTHRDALLAQAQHAAAEELQRRRQEWEQTATQRAQALERATALKLQQALRAAILALTDAPLEEAMGRLFIRRLQALSEGERARLRQGTVCTALPLPVHLQNDLVTLLGPLSFSTAPDEVGIRITSAAWSVSWSIDAYLT